jgi:hypothetical protein
MKVDKEIRSKQQFLEYFRSLYGPEGSYPDIIPGYTDQQVLAGTRLMRNLFNGNSIDIEVIRDFIKILKDPMANTDYNLVLEFTPF